MIFKTFCCEYPKHQQKKCEYPPSRALFGHHSNPLLVFYFLLRKKLQAFFSDFFFKLRNGDLVTKNKATEILFSVPHSLCFVYHTADLSTGLFLNSLSSYERSSSMNQFVLHSLTLSDTHDSLINVFCLSSTVI